MRTHPASLQDVELRTGTRALLGLCALELAFFIAAVGWQKTAAIAIPRGLAGALLIAGGVLAATALLALLVLYRRSAETDRRAFGLGLAVNLCALALSLAAAELLLRSWAVPTRAGLSVGSLTLPPTWDETRKRNRELIGRAGGERERWLSYVVGDPELGWTVGSNRSTPDGLYISSAEGIRSQRPGVAYAQREPKLRIALVGDSHTFSMDGPFEDSWGFQLEQLLGPDVQVLNFGVDGYGIDQSWLRYRRDVVQWEPDIVLFGFVQHDVQRTVAVYPALSFQWDYPFAKPRFAVANDRLQLLNVPLPSSADIVGFQNVADLPFARYDLGYQKGDWRWRSGEPLLLARLFGAAFPRWSSGDELVSNDAAMDISGRVLEAFQRDAWSHGSNARIVYFPSDGAGDFGQRVPDGQRIARRMLAAHGIDYLDLTSCLMTVPRHERLIEGLKHYTAKGNAAVAQCVLADLTKRNWLL